MIVKVIISAETGTVKSQVGSRTRFRFKFSFCLELKQCDLRDLFNLPNYASVSAVMKWDRSTHWAGQMIFLRESHSHCTSHVYALYFPD